MKPNERFRRALLDGMIEGRRQPPGPAPEWALALADAVLAAQQVGGRTEVAAVIAGGVFEAERQADVVRVVATGIEWLGGGIAAVERTMVDLIAGATREVVLTAYSMTLGSERVWDEIERAIATGIRTTLVIDRHDDQDADARALVSRLASRYAPTLQVYDFVPADDRDGLHAKVLVVDREAALIGSANLSHRGLVSAHELSVVIEGPTAGLIVEQVERLVRSSSVHRVY